MKKSLILPIFVVALFVGQAWAQWTACTGTHAGYCRFGDASVACNQIATGPIAEGGQATCQAAWDNCLNYGFIFTDAACANWSGQGNNPNFTITYCKWPDGCHPVTNATEEGNCRENGSLYSDAACTEWIGGKSPDVTPLGCCRWRDDNPSGQCWTVWSDKPAEATECGLYGTYWSGVACPNSSGGCPDDGGTSSSSGGGGTSSSSGGGTGTGDYCHWEANAGNNFTAYCGLVEGGPATDVNCTQQYGVRVETCVGLNIETTGPQCYWTANANNNFTAYCGVVEGGPATSANCTAASGEIVQCCVDGIALCGSGTSSSSGGSGGSSSSGGGSSSSGSGTSSSSSDPYAPDEWQCGNEGRGLFCQYSTGCFKIQYGSAITCQSGINDCNINGNGIYWGVNKASLTGTNGYGQGLVCTDEGGTLIVISTSSSSGSGNSSSSSGGTSSSSDGGTSSSSSSSVGGTSSSSSDGTTSITFDPTIVGLNVLVQSGSLRISSAREATVQLFDINGKRVFREKVPGGHSVVNLKNQKIGVYFAVVSSGSDKQIIKITLK